MVFSSSPFLAELVQINTKLATMQTEQKQARQTHTHTYVVMQEKSEGNYQSYAFTRKNIAVGMMMI